MTSCYDISFLQDGHRWKVRDCEIVLEQYKAGLDETPFET